MTHDNKLQVEAIKRGTVIDHIPAQIGFKLLSLFKLTETDQRITIGLNLPSGEMGRKDLIKIENTFLSEDQVDQLALYAPQATVNRIDNYEVVGKSRPQSAGAHRQRAGLPEQQLYQPCRNRFLPALPCENAPMTSRSNANTVKKSFPIMWCWPINCGW
ncbi:aspartate carbamoyltransferase regulatory subunit [Escherichia coli]|uniref:Aspartate carbamoyltransferase regulatory chain n=17 Tax=Bacteria TaxID=2 RepID=A0A376LGP7_ECOLX|nr:aspartate carbamoyltransferase regulatory subunit [Escherichia coli]